MSPDLPLDPQLAQVATLLEETEWSAELYDSEWRLVWVSDPLKAFIGEEDPEAVGYGRHMADVRLTEPWRRTIDREGEARLVRVNFPYAAPDTPGGMERIVELVGDRLEPGLVEGLEPQQPPPVWTFRSEYQQPDQPPLAVLSIAIRLHDAEGSFIGTTMIHGAGMPVLLLALVAQGDQEMFARMAELREPGRRDTAVMFADIEASGELARRLPSAAYFQLIRRLTTALDAAVLEHSGIVGKHAGDGVSAFFLAEQLGSRSAAAAAAIGAARGATAAAERLSAEEELPIEPGECLINVGLHWAERIFMGQVVTGGRLEVTALGDAINEAARIEQTATRGARLASRPLIEQLEPDDAEALGLDPDRLRYTPLKDLEGASEKAVRDAGGLPLAEV